MAKKPVKFDFNSKVEVINSEIDLLIDRVNVLEREKRLLKEEAEAPVRNASLKKFKKFLSSLKKEELEFVDGVIEANHSDFGCMLEEFMKYR